MTTWRLDSPTEGAHSKLLSDLWVPVTAGVVWCRRSCWDLYLQAGLPFGKCKGTALTRSGDTERPVPEASSRLGPHYLSLLFIYLFFF